MKNSEINIRDPFVLAENGTFYMYGTRAKDFGKKVGGFDVYVSNDLENWSEPKECFNSEEYGMNTEVNWAPEVHKYNGAYYMFASFTQENKKRGTYVLKSDSPSGPFKPHSNGAVTPKNHFSIDGSLYVENGVPYLLYCYEHVEIFNGKMCYVELSPDLTHAVGEPVTLFTAADPKWVKHKIPLQHYITDGPFMYKTKNGTLLMIWSTYINHKYAECVVKFSGNTIKGEITHLEPLIDNDGGHGMIFSSGEKLYLTYHTPNKSGSEHPAFVEIEDNGDSICIKKQ